MPNRPARKLPSRPDLRQLKRQAKELREEKQVELHDAQLLLAQSYGFESWTKLKAYVDGVTTARLADAVREGDIAQVRALLKRRPELVNIDLAWNNEHRALHYAVLHRRADIVRLLMQYGADARKGIYPHRDATSAITLASERGYGEVVAIIRDEEARRTVDKTSSIEPPDGPLAIAVKENRSDVLRELLQSGADPNERVRVHDLDEPEFSAGLPLWICAGSAKYEMAEMLLTFGADPNAMVYASGSAVTQAYSEGDARMIELLKRYGGTPDAPTVGLYHEVELARQMLAGTIPVRLEDGLFAGPTAAEQLLWGGACSGDAEIVTIALEHIDWARDDVRWYRMLEQPLRVWSHGSRFASWDRHTYQTCFRLLLERADPNIRGRFGMTILHDVPASRQHVTAEERVAFATMILDAGARLDVRDDLLKSTPLGWACRWGRVELVKLLLERGADPVEADAEPWARPRAWAEKMGHSELLALIIALVQSP